jgi:hypothetical protein
MLRLIFLNLILFLSSLFLLHPAVANADGIVTATGGSAGTLVTAGLETAGYRMQELVLKDLNGMLHKGAVLIFVALIIFAFTSYVINKRYDSAAWLIIGPVLFLFLVFTTEVGKPKDWRTTASSDPQVQSIVGSEPVSRISWFFHKYDTFISSIYEQLIKVLTSDQSKFVMGKFMTREQILSDLLSSRIEDGGLVSFSVETLAQCSREMDAARAVALGERDRVFKQTSAYLNAKSFYQKSINQPTKFLANSASREYLRALLNGIVAGEASGLAKTRPCIGETNQSISRLGGVENKIKVAASCEELWCWMGVGFEREIAIGFAGSAKRYGLDPATFERIADEIALKLTEPNRIDRFDLTNLNAVQPVRPDSSLIPVIIGGYLVKGMMENLNINSGLLPHFSASSGIEAPSFNYTMNTSPEDLQEAVRRNQQHLIAETKKYEIFSFAMMLPYIQGIMLYGLAVLFPFFCVLAIIPGRLSALLTWMGMWAWVKCWDVGWALVALLENFLWELMPHSSTYEPLRDPNHGPISVFEAAFTGDPAYGLGMYFVIVSLLITSVPFFTAQIMTGTGASIGRHFAAGTQRLNQFLGGQMEKWASAQHQMNTDSMRENFFINYTKERLGQPHNHDPKSVQARGQIAWLRTQAANFRNMKGDVNMAAVLGVNLGMGNPGGALDAKTASQNAAIAFEQMANNIEAETVKMDAFNDYWDATKTPEAFNIEALRAGSSKRRQHWTLPGGGGVQTEIHNKRLQLSMNTANAAAQRKTGTRGYILSTPIKP